MTTEERAGFLAAILNEPTDDMARGAYADALRESEGPFQRKFDHLHGRFIWSGITLAKFRGMEPADDGMFFDAIKEQSETARQVIRVQARHLLGDGPSEWAWDNYPDAPDRVTARLIPPAVEGETTRNRRLRRRAPRPTPTITWERGCVMGMGLTLARWLEVAATVLACCPLECVEIIDVPGLRLNLGKGEHHGWSMRGDLDLPRVPNATNGATYPNAALLVRTFPEDPTLAHDRDMMVRNVWDWTAVLVTRLQEGAGNRWPGAVDVLEQAEASRFGW